MFFDQHMHCFISFDSVESPLEYARKHPDYITFTDHLELKIPFFDFRDEIPDFQALLDTKEDLKALGTELILGVEVGYVRGELDKINAILEKFPFELKVLSAHHNGEYNFMDRVDLPSDVMIHSYLDYLNEALDNTEGFHILAHFDFGFRIHEVSIEDLSQYEEKLDQILRKCIDKEMALELNSKSIYGYDNEALYRWAIERYIALGGSLFALGSDAHHAKDYMLNFHDSINLLEEFGVKEIAVFRGNERLMVSTDDARKVIDSVSPL